jgi:hypothetical protein
VSFLSIIDCFLRRQRRHAAGDRQWYRVLSGNGCQNRLDGQLLGNNLDMIRLRLLQVAPVCNGADNFEKQIPWRGRTSHNPVRLLVTPGIHFSLKASNKYFESEIISTRHDCFKVSSPLIKAVNSIRLLVVHRKPALSSLRCAP